MGNSGVTKERKQQSEILGVSENVEKLELLCIIVGCKMVQPLWERVWQLFKNLNTELPYDPAIPLLGIDPKTFKASAQILVHSITDSSQKVETVPMLTDT